MYLCIYVFIDYQKAFDNIRHDLLMLILQEIGINKKDIRHGLYWNQTAKFKFNYYYYLLVALQTSNIRIAKGIR